MDISEYWNQLAEVYQKKDTVTDWLLGYPVVLKLLGNLKGKTVLDYGCGNGSFARFVLEQQPDATVIGVDTSASAIEHAKEKTPSGARATYKNIKKYNEVRQLQFDAACANFLFCIQPNSDTMIGISAAIYDRLPKGGSFIVLDPNPATHGKRFTSFQAESADHLQSGDRIHVRLFTDSIDLEFDDFYWQRKDYEHILHTAGFRTINVLEPLATTADVVRGAEKEFPPFIIFQGIK